MKNSLVLASMLMATCLSVVDVEASYTEALITKYVGQNVQAEYVLYHGSSAVKKYTYTKVGDNICLKHDFVPAEEPKVDANEKEEPVLPAETRKQMKKMNRIATALNSLSNYSASENLRKDYDRNILFEDKLYFLDSTSMKGNWANLGEVNKSKELWKILEGGLHVDSFNRVNLIKDVILGDGKRLKITLLKSYQEELYFPVHDTGKYDVEEVRVDNLSVYGRKMGYCYNCKLYFQNGKLKFFTYPEYSKKIWLSIDIEFEKQNNPIFKIENIKVVDDTDVGDVFNQINMYELERIPVGW